MYVFRGLIHWGFQLRVGSDPAPLRLRELNDLCIEIQGPHIALTQKKTQSDTCDREKKRGLNTMEYKHMGFIL